MTFDDSRPDDATLERLWLSEPSPTIRDAQMMLLAGERQIDRMITDAIIIGVLLLVVAVIWSLR